MSTYSSLTIPVASSQLRSRSSSPWGAWLFFFSLSKNDDRSLDFICRHARFYLDHKCEINSKRLDPPRSPQGYSLPRRTHGGVQPLGFYLTPISGQAPWFYLWKVGLIQFYFHPTWDLVPILYFQRFSPSAKQASTKGAHFFLGKRVACLSAFAPRKPCQYYLFWTSFFVELSHQGQLLKLISKSTQPNPGYQHLTLSIFSSSK